MNDNQINDELYDFTHDSENGKVHLWTTDIKTFAEAFKEFKDEQNPRKPLAETEFIWCLVGNIIGEHYFGEEKEIRRGTKHFTQNTKTYCFPSQWGGYDKIKVIGLNRHTKKLMTVVMSSRFITNWRLKKIFNRKIIEQMHSQNGWRDTDIDKETIEKMLEWLPEVTYVFKNTTE